VSWRHYPFLAQASALLTSSLDLERTLRRVVQLPLPYLGSWCALHLLDPQGVLQYAHAGHADPAEEASASALWQLALASDPLVREGLAQVLRTGEPAVITASLTMGGQRTLPMRALVQIVRLLNLRSVLVVPLLVRGHAAGVLVFGAQVTRRYHAADVTLACAYAQRVAAGLDHALSYARVRGALEAHTSFVTNLVHDLRNPLTVIKGRAQALRRSVPRHATGMDESRLQSLEDGLAAIDAAASNVAQMVDDLLEVVRRQTTAAPTPLRVEPTDLVALVRRLAAAHQQVAPGHQIEIVVAADDPQSLVGTFDARSIERALTNLLGNAIKYSPQGGRISIHLSHEFVSQGEQMSHVPWAVVRVSDEGVGIPSSDVDRIFEPFYRGTNVLDQIAGTGVGLSAVRQIAEQHGGTVEVESTLGSGTRFTLHLPLDPPAEPIWGAPGASGTKLARNLRSGHGQRPQ
jgi:signal transduction histidine kinase